MNISKSICKEVSLGFFSLLAFVQYGRFGSHLPQFQSSKDIEIIRCTLLFYRKAPSKDRALHNRKPHYKTVRFIVSPTTLFIQKALF